MQKFENHPVEDESPVEDTSSEGEDDMMDAMMDKFDIDSSP